MTLSCRLVLCAVAAALLFLPAGAAQAQGLYDTTLLRTIELRFHDADWKQLLRDNYASETNILADMTVEGVDYPDVGVRIRGNTSYTALPPGSEKFSLSVEIDYVHPDQTLMGYKTLNLNNGFHDPTFCREVAYNNYVARFIPNPRANHVLLTLNGENWGVYINVQQFDKTMLASWFRDTNGLRIKCANSPNGPGLKYNGEHPSGYPDYEIKDDGGLTDPWEALIRVCDSVTNEPLSTWQQIDLLFAIDPSIWSVVLENVFTDDDSYVNKGADFMTYRYPTDARTFLLQADGNETFSRINWSPTMNFTSPNRPVLSHVLAVPQLRQRYLSHYRTVKSDLTWAHFEPIFMAHKSLIEAAVQADPKKLYSYTAFLNNFTSTVILPYEGLAGGTVIGLKQFVEQRAGYLGANAELVAAGPTIDDVHASDATPDPADTVIITASATPAGNPVSAVELFYRAGPSEVYRSVPMTSSGAGLYSAILPIAATAGQRVAYYVGAAASNAYASVTYFPVRTEWDPLYIDYTFGSAGGMRITEWMYSGNTGEYVEFTNLSNATVDMSGWSFDDDHAVPGAFDLSGFGLVHPGESVILTEATTGGFRDAWGLSPGVDIVGELGVNSGNNLARNDIIHLYDASGSLIDRLSYGDQSHPGTIRTQYASGQACVDAIGQDEVHAWRKSAVDDAFGTVAASSGDIGTPGSFSSTWARPEEVSNLRLGPDRVTLRWDPLPGPGVWYDLPRGLVSELPVGSGASETCVVPGGSPLTSATDTAVPSAGAAWWYLVRGRGACGAGSYGNTDTDPGSSWGSTPRSTAVCP